MMRRTRRRHAGNEDGSPIVSTPENSMADTEKNSTILLGELVALMAKELRTEAETFADGWHTA